MAERSARVLRIDADGLVLGLDDDAPCPGCEIGCRGRCNLFAPDAAGRVDLAAADSVVPAGLRVGDRVRVGLDESRLRRAAMRGYGLALVALLTGAGIGHGLALAAIGQGLNIDPDGPTFLGMVVGLGLALRGNRRHRVFAVVGKL